MYRIVEEKGIFTNKSTFYIEKRYKFLFWKWWSRERIYHPLVGMLDYSTDSLQEAKEKLAELNDIVETIIHY